MARKLKTHQTSLGFYDLAIAAPSMKAALEAWGAGSNLFHQGFAKETDDPDVVAAAMAKPGVVMKRPAGSSGPFAEHADLPDLEDGGTKPKKSRRPEPRRRTAPNISVEDSRKAAAQFERDQKRRDAERRREDATRDKERAKRERLVAKAQAALDAAQREHEERSEALDAERRNLEKRVGGEDARWEGERKKLKGALRRARE
ncbi:cell envelope biogenesis protein TolA [Bradyrhizobium japonicum]|uniref:cell envelope biogenesis protein TolA n=1 Tax=Bradyrhizobium japonicum TaxID=375 RepID=UPI002715153A|nr:cell envelope biogenesis protein TolA [Bradyrhizobium japonicum]WLB24290.1 cell envelope biogenesis protein TolA [Bradyrhizobium japonicum]